MERFCCTLEIEDPRPVFCVILEVAALLRVLESLGSSIAHDIQLVSSHPFW